MSDNRPIGIFDSGVGGLTVAKEIYKYLPNESTVYVGDTARVPYGNRSPETITLFSRQITQFLLKENVKAIVVACATASSVALDTLKQEFPQIPIIGVIDAASQNALEMTKTNGIGIIGTRATITSNSFGKRIKQLNTTTSTITQACPLFVPLVEEGILDGPIAQATIDHYLKEFKNTQIDTLIMGCTHYPLLEPLVQQYLPHVQLINVGTSVAHALHTILITNGLVSLDTNIPTHLCYSTDLTDNFTRIAQLFLNAPVELKRCCVDG